MTGNAEDPDIRYDTKEVRKKIASDMKKEKQEIKDVFSREFGKKEKDNPEANDDYIISQPETGKDFKIEWDEEKPDNPGEPKQPDEEPDKKPAKKEFIIEWDEEGDTLR